MRFAFLFAIAAAFILSSCEDGRAMPGYQPRTGGVASRGAVVIVQKGCGSCHTIPGIRGANGLVGPPLMFFGRRTMIAGEVPNTTENLVRWVRSPQSVESGTAMPNLGLTYEDARDVAAYLYTLR
ncbi:MAG TPA: c-type cytochrome [Bryobacteraceae bacterium]|nr:c-type cytochrome [Bryobacteraceae bacterium]